MGEWRGRFPWRKVLVGVGVNQGVRCTSWACGGQRAATTRRDLPFFDSGGRLKVKPRKNGGAQSAWSFMAAQKGSGGLSTVDRWERTMFCPC